MGWMIRDINNRYLQKHINLLSFIPGQHYSCPTDACRGLLAGIRSGKLEVENTYFADYIDSENNVRKSVQVFVSKDSDGKYMVSCMNRNFR